MRVNAARLLATLALSAGLGMTSAHAAAPAKQSAPTKATATAPAVTIKIGDAIVEEYHGGNPASRTTTIRDGAEAQAGKAKSQGKGRA